MAPLPSASGVLRVAFEGAYVSGPWVNVMHVKIGGASPTNAEAATLAGIFLGHFNTRFMGARSSTLNTTLKCVVTDLSFATGARGESATGALGTNAGAALPQSAAVCITWKLQRRYRGGHPRTYLAGKTSTQMESARKWSAAEIAATLTAATSFIADIAAMTGVSAPFQLGQLSYYTNKQLRAVPLFEPFTGAAVDARIDSQRRRLGKDM